MLIKIIIILNTLIEALFYIPNWLLSVVDHSLDWVIGGLIILSLVVAFFWLVARFYEMESAAAKMKKVLDIDPNLSAEEIAKQTGLSQEVVDDLMGDFSFEEVHREDDESKRENK